MLSILADTWAFGSVYFMTTHVRRQFAQRLKSLREAVGYRDAKDFAAALDIQPGTYGRWERAETEPNLDTIVRICTLLGVTPTFLLLGRTHEAANLIAAQMVPAKPERKTTHRVSQKRNTKKTG